MLGYSVHGKKADIVGRELVFDTRISQPNDQLHRGYFFSLPAGAFSASAPSSVSCLPFLMTSGSAGPAAAAAGPAEPEVIKKGKQETEEGAEAEKAPAGKEKK